MAQSKAFYAFGKAVCMPIFKLFYRYKVINKNNIPDDHKGYIIACNHLSYSDPVLLGLGQKRRLNFMAKDELFKNKFFSFIIRHLGAFPVKRGAGGRSKTGELMRPRSGCALIAQQTNTPIVPACITVVGKGIFGKRIIHFSDPITVEEMGLTSVDRRALKNASNMIMGKIKEMREHDLNEYKRS